MSSMNRVFLIGNLTRDPEVRKTPSGSTVADIGLACNRKYKTPEGETREETCFVTVATWGRQAETCAQYLTKGAPILVEGRLKYEEWEKDGQKRNRLTVVGERIQFLGSSRQRSEPGDAPAPKADPREQAGTPAEPQGDAQRGDAEDLPF